jgi:exopolyphosphatase/guanosine-5'-triphosphate,3'-diphosphate pyrophosphatase
MYRTRPIGAASDRPEQGRVGVVDIGSNSIRLVVYDRLCRLPMPVFNEKVLCGLGRDMARTGRLHPDGVMLALGNLARFTRLLQGMGVERVDVLATAAVREAEDGATFTEEVRRRCGLDATVISGAEEARLSAMGVLCGAPGADGVMGDLGGGSLEVVGLDKGGIGPQETLPLGPFRLMDAAGGRKAARALVDQELSGRKWLDDYRGRTFFPVGGAWRTLAKLHMDERGHPLRVIQQYAVPGKDMAQLAGLIAGQGRSSLERMAAVSKRRADTLPYAALVLQALLEKLKPKQVVFSAFGLREGHLYDLLPPGQQAEDPLLHACTAIARRLDRFDHGEVIADWTAGLFDKTAGGAAGGAAAGADERLAVLRRAACLLSDICWAEHPDYRAEHARMRVLRLPVAGLDHAERVFLAVALAVRYGGSPGDPADDPALGLLDADRLTQASLLGQALRLANTLTGGASSLLERTVLTVEDGEVVLSLPVDEVTLAGEAVQRRLDAVAKALNRTGRIVVARKPVPAAGAAS